MNCDFSAPEWAEWLQATGTKFREGIRVFTTQEISEMAARRDLDAQAMYRRLSAIVDTPLVRARADHKVEISAELVAHALGTTAVFLLAVVEPADRGSLESALAEWLDPIAGLDQRADILQAAVAIALQSQPPGPLLGVLTAAWLQTQNLAETHLRDVNLLASEMPEALLDAIELSNRHTHASSQQAAVAALRGVKRDNAHVRQAVLSRARDWLRVVSRDIDGRAKAEPEAERHRRERMLTRLGVDVSGEMTVLGEVMRLVDRDDAQWAEHVPALLEGYALAEAVPALRVAAIAAATAFSHTAWNQLRWVSLLNPIDPEDVAEAVRAAAADMLARVPEPGIAPQLNRRVAELLLHLPGTREDDEAANALEVQLGRTLSYKADYLAHPARSLYGLERRHAIDTLSDESLPLRFRAQRCDELWVDPTFVAPASFCQEIATAAEAIDIDRLYTGRNLTIEDNEFRQMQSVLARCAPRELAALRRRLARTPTTPKMRPARAWQINQALLLYGPDEAAGARAMRLAGRESREGDEIVAGSELLLPELVGLDALAQARLVIDADLVRIPTSITDELLPLTMAQVDQLIERYQHGTPKQQRDVVVVLVTEPPILSDFAWAWVAAFTASEDAIDARLAYMILGGADAMRLGRKLDRQGWSFTAGTDTFSAHAASGALFEATTSRPFEQVAGCLAPWRLLEAVRHRGGDASEARVAVEHLDAILAAGPRTLFDVGARLTVKRESDSTEPPYYSVRPPAPPDPHSAESFRDAFDSDAQMAAQERAGELAEQAICKARQEGASLFLEFITHEDGLAICRHAPEVVQRWIAGHETLNPDFLRRVQQAEGLFLAICEALLAIDPEPGVSLWNALLSALRTRILGPTNVPELLHVLFRAPTSPQVSDARDALLALEVANTDAKLYELALAAQLNGQGDWLEAHIAGDLASDRPWRQQRAATLSGFRIGNRLPVPDAWPASPSRSWANDVKWRSARLQYYEACARHWWREYWRLEDLEEAYAAWVLFWQCADRRAVAWMRTEADASPNSDALQEAKRRHWAANRPDWKKGAEQNRLQLERQFLRRNIENSVWPWRMSR
jgi:hypothetical protein